MILGDPDSASGEVTKFLKLSKLNRKSKNSNREQLCR